MKSLLLAVSPPEKTSTLKGKRKLDNCLCPDCQISITDRRTAKAANMQPVQSVSVCVCGWVAERRGCCLLTSDK